MAIGDAFAKWWVGDLSEERAREMVGDEEFDAMKAKAVAEYVPTIAAFDAFSMVIGYYLEEEFS